MMKVYKIIVFTIIGLTAIGLLFAGGFYVAYYFALEEQQRTANDEVVSVVDTSIIAVLPYENAKYFFKDCKPAALTEGEMKALEIDLSEFINQYNLEQEKHFN